jgi:hypothetical protein
MRKQRFLLNQQKNVSIERLEEWFEKLSVIDEATWAAYEFTKEMLRDKLSMEERGEIINNSIICGKQWAQKMLVEYHLDHLSGLERATKLAEKLGLTISRRSGCSTKYRMVFAQFIMDQGIEIIHEPITKYINLAEKSEKLPDPRLVCEILIAHEVFHYLEEHYGEDMYPNQKTIRLWRLFNYEHRSTVASASEIAAMAFAKELCAADFVPQVLNVLLSYLMEIQLSKNIYKAVTIGIASLEK